MKKIFAGVLIFMFIFLNVANGVCGGTSDEEIRALKTELQSLNKQMQQLMQRIEQLETEQKEVKQVVKEEGKLPAKAEGLSWHGYYAWNFEEESRNGINPSFDAFALSLISALDLNEDAKLYSQIIYEHAPFYDISVSSSGTRSLDARSSGELTVNDIYMTYTLNDWLKIRAGKFATPFGLWNTLMYASPVYVTVKQPGRDTLYSRGSTTDTDSNLFGRYSMGAWLLGSYDIFSYDLYVTNGRTKLAQHRDDNRDKGFGARLGVDLPVGASKLKLLYSRYQDELRTTTTEPFFKQYTNAFSSEYSLAKFKLTSEFAISERNHVSLDTYYLLAEYTLRERIIPYAQYQFYEPNRDVANDETGYSSIGLCYHLIPWKALVKLQLDKVEAEDPAGEDYHRYLLGVTAAF